MQSTLHDIFTSKLFYTPVVAWLIAQLIKTAIDFFLPFRDRYEVKEKETDREGRLKKVAHSLLWRTGGMPSSHSAMSTSLVTAVGFQEGVTSAIFVVSFFFTLVVIRDSLGVRRIAGMIGHTVNLIIKEYNEQAKKDNKENVSSLIEIEGISEGHSTLEVLVGVMLGFFVGLSIYVF